MNYQQKLRESELRFRMKAISYELITKWIECARNRYGFHDIDSNNINEADAESDFSEELLSAIQSLIEEVSIEKTSIPGWSFGYICGHIQGSLNAKWTNQYIIVGSNEYNDLMKIKTIIELMRVAPVCMKKIGLIYDYFTKENKQLSIDETDLPLNVVSLVRKGKLPKSSNETYKKSFDEYFSKLFMDNYMSLLRSYNIECCPALRNYLVEHEVINVIGKEYFA